jgi:hypothetical protein
MNTTNTLQTNSPHIKPETISFSVHTTLKYRQAVKQTSSLRSTHWQSSKPHHFGEETGSQANIASSEYRLVANGFYSYKVERSHTLRYRGS